MRLDDGYQTLITFALNGAVKLYEQDVTPPGLSSGGSIDTTTMRNATVRTAAPKKLLTVNPVVITAAYDPAVFDQLLAMVGENQQITITYPDESTITFFGWIDDATPSAIKEGAQPTLSLKVMPSNVDDSGNESVPVFAA